MVLSREEHSYNQGIMRSAAKKSAVWMEMKSWAAIMKGHQKEGDWL